MQSQQATLESAGEYFDYTIIHTITAVRHEGTLYTSSYEYVPAVVTSIYTCWSMMARRMPAVSGLAPAISKYPVIGAQLAFWCVTCLLLTRQAAPVLSVQLIQDCMVHIRMQLHGHAELRCAF